MILCKQPADGCKAMRANSFCDLHVHILACDTPKDS